MVRPRHSLRRLATAALLCATVALLSSVPTVSAKQKVLLYSRTAGFRHYNIPTAIATLKKWLGSVNVTAVATEDPSVFEEDGYLDGFDALVFMSVSGSALSDQGRKAMQTYVEDGGGFMGIHQSCDALLDSAWYGRLIGAFFNNHPFQQKATYLKQSKTHPSVSKLPNRWRINDEIYSFTSDPRDAGKKVVLTVQEGSFVSNDATSEELAAKEGSPHPIAWYSDGDDEFPGRTFYTALGHTNACWKDRNFKNHIMGALTWVLESKTIQSNGAGSKAPGTSKLVTQQQDDGSDDGDSEGGPASGNGGAAASTAASSAKPSSYGGTTDGGFSSLPASASPNFALSMALLAAMLSFTVALANLA